MVLQYGYEIEGETPGTGARLVNPPLLQKSLSLSANSATSKFSFIGTRAEILEWMRQHGDITIENRLWNERPTSYHTYHELVIDLLTYSDPEQSTVNYLKSFFVTDTANEKVKVEIRAQVEKVDMHTLTQCRVILNSGVAFGEIVDDLERQWYKPGPSYMQQVVNIINDVPGPEVVLSSDVPMGVFTEESASAPHA